MAVQFSASASHRVVYFLLSDFMDQSLRLQTGKVFMKSEVSQVRRRHVKSRLSLEPRLSMTVKTVNCSTMTTCLMFCLTDLTDFSKYRMCSF